MLMEGWRGVVGGGEGCRSWRGGFVFVMVECERERQGGLWELESGLGMGLGCAYVLYSTEWVSRVGGSD